MARFNESEEPTVLDTLDDEDVLTEGPKYNVVPQKSRVNWYRPKLTREELAYFNKRSNFLGFAQTLGYLGLLATSAWGAIYFSTRWPWYVTGLLVFVNGHFWNFMINGFHELVHDSVFRSKWLNRSFLRLFSFLGWSNHHHFWASHTEHHKYALHPPDDLEVAFPAKFDFKNTWKFGILNYKYPYDLLYGKFKAFFGHIPEDTWTGMILPESDPERRNAYSRWERILLIGHLSIAVTAVSQGYWMVLLVFTFPKMFGRWLHNFCNSAQHIGLQDKVPDFRLCCRTIYLNPFVQFLYWHMNYHIEHHMYAAVRCYRLGKLHRRIKDELPYCPNGLRETWKHIAEILDREKIEPGYQFVAELPNCEESKVLAGIREET